MSIWREIGHFVGYKFGGIYFHKSSCAILVDIFWHEIRRSNFKWFQIGIDQTMKQVIPEMILIWRVEIYCRLPFYLKQSGFVESIAIKISKFSYRSCSLFVLGFPWFRFRVGVRSLISYQGLLGCEKSRVFPEKRLVLILVWWNAVFCLQTNRIIYYGQLWWMVRTGILVRDGEELEVVLRELKRWRAW